MFEPPCDDVTADSKLFRPLRYALRLAIEREQALCRDAGRTIPTPTFAARTAERNCLWLPFIAAGGSVFMSCLAPAPKHFFGYFFYTHKQHLKISNTVMEIDQT